MVVATHYEGDPCDNTRNFYKYLKKALKGSDKPLDGMNYTIFGLGDTSYEQYNEMGVQFEKGFDKLGAKKIYDCGVGNAETFSTETDFAAWKESLWTKLTEHYAKFDSPEKAKKALTRRASLRKANPDALPWLIAEEGPVDAEPAFDMNMRNYIGCQDIQIAGIREMRQQPSGNGASTLEVAFQLKGSGLKYNTAANFAVYVPNPSQFVTAFAAKHNLDLN